MPDAYLLGLSVVVLGAIVPEFNWVWFSCRCSSTIVLYCSPIYSRIVVYANLRTMSYALVARFPGALLC